jgi:phenol 2-monooxygenase
LPDYSPNSAMETTDVLIVGAGPSGLMTALSLGKYGVRTTIVERRYARYAQSDIILVKELSRRQPGTMYGNADTIQPGTIEMLQAFGLRERFTKESLPVYAYVRGSFLSVDKLSNRCTAGGVLCR